MPDRRQGDRRESNNGFASKQIKVSLGTFVFVILFIIALIVATISCIVTAKIYYNKGYYQGIIDYENSTTLDSNININEYDKIEIE